MATTQERAVALKNEGNKAFSRHDWTAAIDYYSKAIELNDKEPTFWANRAQMCVTLPGSGVLACRLLA